MKKIIFSIFAVALLSSCSKDKSGVAEENAEALVPISLGSEVAAKAPIVPALAFDAGIAGWEQTSTPDYSTEPTWNTKVSTTAVAPGTAAAAVTWTDQQYYHADAALSTYLKAWYPEGVRSTNTVAFSNEDGSVDAMLAATIKGNKKDATNKVLAFEHKTTQFTFTVQAGAGSEENMKLSSITIKNAGLPTGFNLATDAVVYAAAADLTVPGIDGTKVVGSSADVVGHVVMIQPNTESNEILLDIVTDKMTYTNQKATVAAAHIAAGTHYVVALTFGQVGVELEAAITQWISSTGSATIE